MGSSFFCFFVVSPKGVRMHIIMEYFVGSSLCLIFVLAAPTSNGFDTRYYDE